MTGLSSGSDYRWPRKGDRLLRDSDDWDKAINFSDQALSRHAQIWSGYMHAGDALIGVCDRTPSERNELIYPILFSYRHGLEMAMKWIISRYGRSAGVSEPELDHNLWHLWQSCKAVLEHCCPDPEGANAIVESVVKEFHDLHRAGLSFRYSVNEHGALYPLPDGLLDLANVRDVMKGVAHFFDGTDAMLGELASYSF